MTQPHPDLRIVRTKSISWIELIYPCGHTGQILPNKHAKGLTYNGKRPVAFKWHNPGICKIDTPLLFWIMSEFIHIFKTDAFKWQASCYTAPKELQCHILGLFNN